MLLTLIRHGEASSPTRTLGDEGRYLTTRGREQARATAQALASRGLSPSAAWTSPLVRAVQTAELILAPLEFSASIVARDDLFPGSDPHSLLSALSELDEHASVIAVGHQPFMSTAASILLGHSVSAFPTAAAFHFEITAGLANATLEWRSF